MSTRRYVRILLAVALVLAPAALGVLGGPGVVNVAEAAPIYTITVLVSPIGSGTVDVVPNETDYELTASPVNGWHFVDWSGDVTVADSPVTVTRDTATIVTANFAVDQYTLTYNAGPGGTISGDASQTVDYLASGTPVTAVADTAAGYHFVSWSDGVLTATRTDADVTADQDVTATFAIDAFTITPSAGLHGFISPSSPQNVEYGQDQAFTITPAGGYYIADVLIDGTSVGPATSYAFTAVSADHTISASFEPGVQTGLWISSAKSVVTYGSSTVLRGELYDASDPGNPVGLGGRQVAVQYASSPTAPSWEWQTLDVYPTSSETATLGQFSVVISPKAPTYYRLQYVKVPLTQYGGFQSEVKKVGVRPALGRPVRPRSVRARRYFTVYGSLKPHFTAGQKTVKIKVYRYRKGRYRYVKTLRATNVDKGSITKYRLRTRLTTKGKYRFRATSRPTGWAVKTTSLSKTLVVR